ncbi:MAG: hypothetical protein V4642_01680 [Bacteroidota bacterium]
MNILIYRGLLILIFLIACNQNVKADGEKYAASFLEIPLGARALGMGSAFSSVADDGTAFFWNPAGTSLVKGKVLSAMYSSQHGSIGNPLANYLFTGVTVPISSVNVSLNWIRFSADDMQKYDDLTRIVSTQEREERVRRAEQGDFFSNSEDAFIFSFAKNNILHLDWGWSLFEIPIEIPVGANFKIIRQKIGENSASGIGVDLGTMIRFNLKDFAFSEVWPQLSFSLNVKDIGGSKITWDTQRQHRIEQSTVYGVSLNQPLEFIDTDVLISYDRDNRYDGANNFGVEGVYKKQFSIRTGLQKGGFTAGAGIDFNFFTVDYSYLGTSDAMLGNVHRLGGAFQIDKLFTK